ncbi:hypothetical protein [Aeromicrobium sp. Sec7.5]|uniref:hypothetical protein n=1 Tax=Aeromicrobium sp. Sec7.5 TaxID=3121276 RepID=UPI002FE462B4
MLEIVLTAVAVVLVAVLAVVALGAWRFLRATRSARRRLRQLGGHREVAVLLGRASVGRDQSPTVGTLVRTDDVVVLVPATAGSEVLVARDDLTAASTTTSFLGRSFGEPVLLLTWEEHGLGDAVALRVGDPQTWITALTRPVA